MPPNETGYVGLKIRPFSFAAVPKSHKNNHAEKRVVNASAKFYPGGKLFLGGGGGIFYSCKNKVPPGGESKA